jgi:hypothetical protein
MKIVRYLGGILQMIKNQHYDIPKTLFVLNNLSMLAQRLLYLT